MTKRISRLNSRELLMMRKFLISRDGNKCNICGKPGTAKKLIVDHVDNDFLNNEKGNLQLCCQSCNIKKNPPHCSKKDVDNFSLSISHSPIPSDLDDSKSYLSSAPDITLENFPIWKNLRSEPLFQKWLWEEMTRKLTMEVAQVINDGANIAKCSSKTTIAYLDKLVYETGPYTITKVPENGLRMLCWKEKHFPFKEQSKKWTK